MFNPKAAEALRAFSEIHQAIDELKAKPARLSYSPDKGWYREHVAGQESVTEFLGSELPSELDSPLVTVYRFGQEQYTFRATRQSVTVELAS